MVQRRRTSYNAIPIMSWLAMMCPAHDVCDKWFDARLWLCAICGQSGGCLDRLSRAPLRGPASAQRTTEVPVSLNINDRVEENGMIS